MQLLKHTYGSRLPPHKIYRELFNKEQGDESTDVFVCKATTLLAQLPPGTLAENPVQLDMVYGLLHRKIREKVVRVSVMTFSELLEKARAVEDLFEERRMRPHMRQQISSNRSLAVSSSTSNNNQARINASVATSYSGNNKFRPHCAYCKKYGHDKETCHKRPQVKMGQQKKDISNNETGAKGTSVVVWLINSELEIKLADGSVCNRNVEIATVNVDICGIVVSTTFVLLPGIKDTLLGMNFIKDSGMVIDLKLNRFSLRDVTGTYFPGKATKFAVHRINTGDYAPIEVPRYRLTHAKKEIVRAELN
ncbi:unnamed protein product [Parnassius mnemosyne]|uniref:Polyprotein n=1 Tax=Parnassius mnemosyne TaxID=213953 RepID=A0AAV1LX51_9NEOP